MAPLVEVRARGVFLAAWVLAVGCSDDGEGSAQGGASDGHGGSAFSKIGSMGGDGGGTGGEGGARVTESGNAIISASPNSTFEAEASIAATPTGHVAAAWIAIDEATGPFIGYGFSLNDGASWLPAQQVATAEPSFGADPAVAADAEGNFYLSWIGFAYDATGPHDRRVYVARAFADTPSFEVPAVASDPAEVGDYDKPWITVTEQGTVVVSYSRSRAKGTELVVARSTDGASTFTRATAVHDTFANLAFPCAGGGRLYLVYLSSDGERLRVMLRYSDTDGKSWPASNELVVADEPNIAFHDPNCTASGDELWISYGVSNDLPSIELTPLLHGVRIAHSTDGGTSIAGRYEPQGEEALSLLPQLAQDAGGALHVSFYAGLHDEDPNGAFRLVRALGAPLKVEESALVEGDILFLAKRAHPQWLGDYTGLFANERAVYVAFPVNAGGYSHVAFHRTPLRQ